MTKMSKVLKLFHSAGNSRPNGLFMVRKYGIISFRISKKVLASFI